MTTKSNHYIDNKKFFEAMQEYHARYTEAKANDTPLPEISDYIGRCFLLIAERLSMSHNFARYPFRDEMISDAVENCVLYIHSFDPKKSSNPFAYFTQFAYYAFVRRIKKEKRQAEIKQRYVASLDINEFLHSLGQEDGEHQASVVEFLRSQNIEFNDNILPPTTEKISKRRPKYFSEK